MFSELKKYGLDRELKRTTGTDFTMEDFYHKSSGLDGARKHYKSHGPNGSDAITEQTLKLFFNIDGYEGGKLLNRPYDREFVKQIPLKYLKMTSKDRMDELDVPEEHKALAATVIETIGVAPLDKTPFFEALRWFGLSGWSIRQFWESCAAFNLINGTTSLALAIQQESRADILLSTPIASVKTASGSTTVTARSGQKFTATQVISTLPVNCLGDVEFDPPIDPRKLAAAKEQHLTKVVKMHTYTKKTLAPTIITATSPNKIAFGFTEANVHSGEGTFSVFFGSEQELDRASPEATFKDFAEILPEQFSTAENPDVKPDEMFWHDWTNDEFAKGAWATFPMGWQENYLDALRADEHDGKVIFASAEYVTNMPYLRALRSDTNVLQLG